MSARINQNNNYKQGVMLTEDLQGYIGKKQKIEILSSYEFKTVKMLQQLSILKRIDGWANEESIFKYMYSLDNKEHRYLMDFTLFKGDYVIFIEVKPKSKLVPPAKPKNIKSERTIINYKRQVEDFIKNQDKWNAVREWCKLNNTKIGYEKYKFLIWTEDDLSI